MQSFNDRACGAVPYAANSCYVTGGERKIRRLLCNAWLLGVSIHICHTRYLNRLIPRSPSGPYFNALTPARLPAWQSSPWICRRSWRRCSSLSRCNSACLLRNYQCCVVLQEQQCAVILMMLCLYTFQSVAQGRLQGSRAAVAASWYLPPKMQKKSCESF